MQLDINRIFESVKAIENTAVAKALWQTAHRYQTNTFLRPHAFSK